MVSLSLDPPPTSRRTNRPSPPSSGRRWVLVAGFLFTGAAGFVAGRWSAGKGGGPSTAPAPAPAGSSASTTNTASSPAQAAAPAPGQAAPAPTGIGTGPATPQAAAAPVAPEPSPAPPAGNAPRRLLVTLTGPLEEAVSRGLPATDRAVGEQLTQVVNRLLVWEFQVARDGRKGDQLEVLWFPAPRAGPGVPSSGEPVVDAVRYTSQKLGRTIEAFRYQPEGAKFPRYYRGDGSELEERLVDSPIAEYDQVTSLLRDGRRHKGVDFRTPAGTPVTAPFEGVIERRNWNFAGNGNCLDVRDPASGRHAIFLHLEPVSKDMSPGRKVRKGEQIARSGNSGHSTAPHLHYQLEAADGRILDPFEIHQTKRVALPAAEKVKFEAHRAALAALVSGASPVVAAPAAVPAPQVVPAVAR